MNKLLNYDVLMYIYLQLIIIITGIWHKLFRYNVRSSVVSRGCVCVRSFFGMDVQRGFNPTHGDSLGD